MSHIILLVLGLAASLMLVSVAARMVVGKLFKDQMLADHHKVIDPLLGVVGMLYSMVLGFMVGGAMDHYEDCVAMVDHEANSMANVFRLAQGLHTSDRQRIRNLCRGYAAAVVDDEWQEMKHNEPVVGAFTPYQGLWDAAVSIHPGDNERINNVQGAILQEIGVLGENRRTRIVASQHGLTFAQWLVVGVGSLITVLFCFFFPLNRAGFQTYLTGLVAVSLGLNIWLLSAYSTPFAGPLQIQPHMFTLHAKGAFASPDSASKYLNESDKQEDEADDESL